MSFFDTEIENLTYSDIRSLVTNLIPESSNLDYKEEMIANDKLAKSMIAFANGTGGYIVLGIKEHRDNKNNKTGIPESIVGIPKQDYISNITNIALSYSDPKIIPSVNDKIELPSDPDKIVLVVHIVESLKPIMLTSKNSKLANRWYIRINDKTEPADYGIMKKLFNKENYRIEKKVQQIYDSIQELFDQISIDDVEHKPRENISDFIFSLRNQGRDQIRNDQRLKQYQKVLNIYMKIFEEEIKYFGGMITKRGNISLCFRKYEFLNNRIRCPSFIGFTPTNIIENLLTDMKTIAKKYFQIDLNY